MLVPMEKFTYEIHNYLNPHRTLTRQGALMFLHRTLDMNLKTAGTLLRKTENLAAHAGFHTCLYPGFFFTVTKVKTNGLESKPANQG